MDAEVAALFAQSNFSFVCISQVFRQLGVKNSDILERWFTGPAFLPWFRMGNLIKWGGPLSQEYIDNQVKRYECTVVNVVNKNLVLNILLLVNCQCT